MTPRAPIYMDNHATTRVDPRVVESMLPFFDHAYGNAGSASHQFGWTAAKAVDQSRAGIAGQVGSNPNEIVFTSGATESNNLAIRGAAQRYRKNGHHLVSVATEHSSVLEPLQKLARDGFEVSLLPVVQAPDERAGMVLVDQVLETLREDTILVSVALANNEIGVIQPVAEIGQICKDRGILLHCDATQAVGRVPVDVEQLQVDLMSFSAHKLYGPKGVGALYVRRRRPSVWIDPLVTGGGQEMRLRAGTLNVPGIVGFSKAMEICVQEMPVEEPRVRALRNRLYDGLTGLLSDVVLNGPALSSESLRLAGNLNVSFARVEGESLLMSVGDLAASTGSACKSTCSEPSHVLRSLGVDHELVRSGIRFGLGRFNTMDEVEEVIELLVRSVHRLRNMLSAPSCHKRCS